MIYTSVTLLLHPMDVTATVDESGYHCDDAAILRLLNLYYETKRYDFQYVEDRVKHRMEAALACFSQSSVVDIQQRESELEHNANIVY